MFKKNLRKKVLNIRKKIDPKVNKIDFIKILNLIKKKKRKIIIGGYFPVNHEIDDLEILKRLEKKKYKICLPVIKKKFNMDFYKFSFTDPLIVTTFCTALNIGNMIISSPL